MATEYGEPEVLKGYGRRNTTLMAIAPTTSSAFILGQVSEWWCDFLICRHREYQKTSFAVLFFL
jgi:hypothetical protein